MKNFKNRCLTPGLLALSLIAVCGSVNAADNIIEVADKAGTFKTLLAAAKAAGLVHTLQEDGPFTVFAPTDDAFAKLPADTLSDLLKPENKEALTKILKYHLIPRRLSFDDIADLPAIKTAQGAEVRVQVDVFAHPAGLAINHCNIISGDIDAANGVIHVIDKVLLPPAGAPDNIVDVADKAGTFKTLLAAAKAAGLAHTLQEDGPFTIFAPTDDAFAKLPPHTLNDLLKPENKEKLATILKCHVISGKVTATDAVKVESAKSLSGDSVRIAIRDGRLAVNDANVIANDVEASNGIIHVIDKVLLPTEKPVTYIEAGADVALLTRIDPTFESSLASKSGGKGVSISFCNLSSRSMLVYWIFPSGARRQWRGEIAPGKLDICGRTFENHVWLIADEHGKTLGLYVVGDQDAIIVNSKCKR